MGGFVMNRIAVVSDIETFSDVIDCAEAGDKEAFAIVSGISSWTKGYKRGGAYSLECRTDMRAGHGIGACYVAFNADDPSPKGIVGVFCCECAEDHESVDSFSKAATESLGLLSLDDDGEPALPMLAPGQA